VSLDNLLAELKTLFFYEEANVLKDELRKILQKYEEERVTLYNSLTEDSSKMMKRQDRDLLKLPRNCSSQQSFN